jgi:hypothetical protein
MSEQQRQATLLANETGCDPRTARKWLQREGRVLRSLDAALTVAAHRLKIERLTGSFESNLGTEP